MNDGSIPVKVDVSCVVVCVCGQGKFPLLQFYLVVLHSASIKELLSKRVPPSTDQFSQARTNNAGMSKMIEESLSDSTITHNYIHHVRVQALAPPWADAGADHPVCHNIVYYGLWCRRCWYTPQ